MAYKGALLVLLIAHFVAQWRPVRYRWIMYHQTD